MSKGMMMVIFAAIECRWCNSFVSLLLVSVVSKERKSNIKKNRNGIGRNIDG